MRTIIAGSRTCTDIKTVMAAVADCGWIPTEIISGTARGVDQLGEVWAKANGTPLRRFPADWKKNGKAAGVIRNTEMAENADALIAVWDGVSRGTKHMIDIANRKGLRVYVYLTTSSGE